MKTRNFLYVALAFMALSCAKEIAPDTSAPEQDYNIIEKSFTAGIETTKTSMVDGFKIQWKANDGVTIIDNVAKKAVKYLAAETGAVSAINPATAGTGVAEGATEIYAAYPWRDGNNALFLENGDELNNCYLTPDQRPSRNGYYASVHYAMAKADATDNLHFKNVNGFIKFNIAKELDELVKAVYIISNNDEEICGAFKMKWNNGDPQYVYKDNSANRPYVRAYNSNGGGLRTGDYFLGILPVTFEKGFTVVLQMLDGTQLYKRTEKTLTVDEGEILPMKALAKAEYDTDDVNYFVLYNEGFDVTFGDVTINKTNFSTFKYVSKHREENVRGDNLFFVSPSADDAVISGTPSNYAVIGTNKNQRSKVTQNGHMGVVDGGKVYMFANLEVTHGDVSLVRGFPSKFGNIVISNCAFKTMPRHLLDMHNGTTYDNSTLESVVIEDSELCFVNCASDYAIIQRSNKNHHIGTFKFENNIVTSTGSESKNFRLIGGYSTNSNTGTVVTDFFVNHNTFHNTCTGAFMSVAGIEDEYYCTYNLFVVPLTKNLELLTVYQKPETDRIDPQSGECISNYFYSGTEFIWNRGSKYQGNLSRAGSPVKLSVSPLSSIWDPVNGKFGAYSFTLAGDGDAPAYNKVGAQRPDMVPVTAVMDSPAADYTTEDLGSY